jgi:hypothetical protein
MQAVQNFETRHRKQSQAMKLHAEAVASAKDYFGREANLLEVITKVEEARVYFEFELTSLEQYCVEMLNLTAATARNFIVVMKKSVEVPALAEAIYSGKTTVSKARKICSVITQENAKDWIDLVIHCSCRVVEKCVAQTNPRSAVPESLKYVSSDVLELRLAVSEEWARLLAETKDRLSQKEQRAVSTEEALFILMREAHEKNDPVRKAKRAKARAEKTPPASTEPSEAAKRSRYRPAHVRHEIILRDQGRCVHVNPNGKRCENTRWTDHHHIIEFANGGEHTVENLETLCWGHHRIRHATH